MGTAGARDLRSATQNLLQRFKVSSLHTPAAPAQRRQTDKTSALVGGHLKTPGVSQLGIISTCSHPTDHR